MGTLSRRFSISTLLSSLMRSSNYPLTEDILSPQIKWSRPERKTYKAKFSRYTGEVLRKIRKAQTKEAIKGHTHYNDGTLINENKLIDLHQ